MSARRAQSTVELVVLVAMVAMGFFFVMWHLRAAMVGYWRGLGGSNPLYAPGYTRTDAAVADTLTLQINRTTKFIAKKCDPDDPLTTTGQLSCGDYQHDVPPGRGNEVMRFEVDNYTLPGTTVTDTQVNASVDESYDHKAKLFQR